VTGFVTVFEIITFWLTYAQKAMQRCTVGFDTVFCLVFCAGIILCIHVKTWHEWVKTTAQQVNSSAIDLSPSLGCQASCGLLASYTSLDLQSSTAPSEDGCQAGAAHCQDYGALCQSPVHTGRHLVCSSCNLHVLVTCQVVAAHVSITAALHRSCMTQPG
jgi:hypothetical protein